jgi:hypothetical protein
MPTHNVSHKIKLTAEQLDTAAQALHLLRAANYWNGVICDERAETINAVLDKIARALEDRS